MDASCESVRGSQFSSGEYQWFLEAHCVICGMSVVGSCADNAPAESFLCAETGTDEQTARQ